MKTAYAAKKFVCILHKMKKAEGITLIELLVVIAIIGILAVALGFSYQGWVARYRVEAQVKQIYTDMMNARVRALTMKTVHSVTLDAVNNNYSIFDNAVLLPTYPKAMPTNYVLNINITGGGNTITFDTRGIASPSNLLGNVGTVWITPALPDADYDCVVVAATRVNIGLMAGGACGEK